MESWMQSWRPRTNASCDFSSPCLWSIAPAAKKWCQVIQNVAPVTQNLLSKTEVWCSKMQPISGNQRPDLLTYLMNMSLVLRLPRKMHLSRSSSSVRRLPSFLEMLENPHVFLTSDNVHNPWRRPRGTTSERPKVLRTRQFFALLTWRRASRHNGVHFFDISTSKSVPKLKCFVHFDLEVRFAQKQQRALFRHHNFQKDSDPGVFCEILTWKCAARHNGVHFFDISTSKSESEHGVLCTFWLGNVLRATTACNFSSLIWPHGSAPAALASLLFDHPEPQIIGKRSESPLFYLFAHLHLLSSHSFSSLIFSLLLFSSLTVPTSAFPSLHIVGSLTSKLPSITVRGTTRGREKLLLCFLNQWSQEQIINQKLRPKMNRSMINDKMSSIFKDCKSLFDVFRCVSMLNGCSKMVQLVAFCSSHVSEATEAARSPAQNAHFANSVDENGPQHSRDRLTKWTDMDNPTSHVGPMIGITWCRLGLTEYPCNRLTLLLLF